MQIKKLELVMDSTTVCKAILDDGSIVELSIDSFQNERMRDDLSEVESCSIRQHEQVVIIIALLASGQCGYIIVWDCFQNKVLHISEGSFTCYATIIKKNVIALRLVSTFVHAPEFAYTVCPFEIMEPYVEREFHHLSLNPNLIKSPFDQCWIDEESDKVRFIANGQIEEVKF